MSSSGWSKTAVLLAKVNKAKKCLLGKFANYLDLSIVSQRASMTEKNKFYGIDSGRRRRKKRRNSSTLSVSSCRPSSGTFKSVRTEKKFALTSLRQQRRMYSTLTKATYRPVIITKFWGSGCIYRKGALSPLKEEALKSWLSKNLLL